MGKKYIVEIGRLERLYKAFINAYGKPEIAWLSPEVDLTPYTEPDLEQVKADAYNDGYKAGREAERVRQPDLEQVRKEAYAEGFKDGQYAERNGLIASYAQKQEEIKVGDEVIPRETEYDTMIVTRLWKDDYDSDCIDAIGFDGKICSFLVSRVSKTGKHYGIATILENMREGQDE